MTAFENAVSVGTWEWNVGTGQAIVNERWAEIVGYSLSELAPITIDTWTRLVHPDDLARSSDLLNRHCRGEVDHYECEARMRHKDGHWVWVLDRGKVVSWTADGRPEWMAGTHWDISERKRAEETLEQNQQQFDRVLGAINEGWWEFDLIRDTAVYSPRWWQILGYAENELPATTDLWRRLLHPDDVARVDDFVQDVLVSGQEKFDLSFRQKHKDGHYITVLSRGSVQRDAEGRIWHISGSNNDITVRVQLEEALRQSEERYRLAQTAAGVGIWDWDLVGGQVVWDATCWTMLGHEPSNRLLTYDEWANSLHPDDREHTVATVQDQLAKGGTFVVEFRYRRADGGWQWLQGRGRVVARADDGAPTRMMGTHTDISGRKRIDETLQRSNAELEQFAYIASHDLRQPLRMINSYTQLLERALADRLDDTSREFMGFVREGAQRMDQMLVSLLEYSRVGRQGEPMAAFDSRGLAEEAVLFLNPAIVEARAEITLTGDWPTVHASRNEGVRLFQNLVGNAVKYRSGDRLPVVRLDVHRDGSEWVFRVSDNGIGIDPNQFDRLFKVFQRLHTRGSYEGSGIGLAVCRKIVERHGGRIWVESDGPDKGSTFCFTLPDAGADRP
ncbi:MAG: PAS domain-containing protein [Rhodospirillaceae bacterium]